MECSPAKFVVCVSKTGPMRTLSFKGHTNFACGVLRGSVLSLHTPKELNYSKILFANFVVCMLLRIPQNFAATFVTS